MTASITATVTAAAAVTAATVVGAASGNRRARVPAVAATVTHAVVLAAALLPGGRRRVTRIGRTVGGRRRLCARRLRLLAVLAHDLPEVLLGHEAARLH